MAGIILTSVLKILSTCTPKASTSSSTVLQSSAEQELQMLQRTMRRIRAVLEDAEDKDISDRSEQLRLRELKEVAYDAEDAVDEYEYEVLHAKVEARRQTSGDKHGEVIFDLNSFHPDVPISNELVGRIKDIRQRFEEITDDWNRLELCLLEKGGKRRCIKKWKPTETASWFDEDKTFGREDEKNEIIKWLESESSVHSVSVLCIVGMGGLGKTTLAQMSYNDSRACQRFSVRGWVYVYDDFDVVNLVKKICKSFGMRVNYSNDMSLDQLRHELKMILDGKEFFLVLDDVWNQKLMLWDSLKSFLVGVGTGKVLVTTRNQSVAKIMQTTSPIILNHLSADDSWLLFKKIAYKGGSHNLLKIGKKIVHKCGGLPLAIKVLAGILSLEEEEEAWLDIMESELWEFDKENDDNIFPILKLSYDHLPVEMNQCFMYLCLFHKGSELDKSSIIQQWISHGFIQPKGKKMEEDVGNDYFNELLHRSMLQYGHGGVFIMRDLIHDLAQYVAKDEYLSIAPLKSQYMIPETIRHLYVHIRDEFEIINMEPLGEAKKLRTLILRIDDDEIPNMDFLSNLTCLRTLVLPKWCRKDLLKNIDSIKHLRYLDIGFCMSIPTAVYKLHHLHTLKSSSTFIKFSRDIGDLINLRHIKGLDNRNYSRYPLPREVLGLTNLRTMPHICLGNQSNGNQFWKLRDLKKLPNIRGSVKVEGLETVAWADVNPLEASLKDTRGFERLTLCWRRVVSETMDERLATQVLDSLQPHRGLKKLRINNYPGVVLPMWLGHELPALEELSIVGAKRVKSFVVPVQNKREEFWHKRLSSRAVASTQNVESRRWFPFLKELWLINMDKLEEWQGAEDRQLPCLHKLYIENCPKLRKLPSLSHLSTLHIRNMDELEWHGVEDRDLPCLHELDIYNCPKLWKLPSLSRLSSLSIYKCFELKSFPSLPMLRSLVIAWYRDETLIFSHDGSLNELEKLSIHVCEGLRSVGLSGLGSLQELMIKSCPRLSTWRSSNEDPVLLPTSTSLQQLVISGCPLLRISPDERLPPNLQYVQIRESPGAEEWYQNQVLSTSRCQATYMEQDPTAT